MRDATVGTISCEYDPLDRPVKIIDQDDYAISYRWRADGQKSEIKVTNPSATPIYQVQYYYDSLNRLYYLYEPLQAENKEFSVVFDYDIKGNRLRQRLEQNQIYPVH